MARLKFCGFDYTYTGGNPVNAFTSFNANVFDFALDAGMQGQSFASDSVFWNPGDTVTSIVNFGYPGRNVSDGGSFGYIGGSGNSSLGSLSLYTQGVTCLRSVLGDPTELWVTFDFRHQNGSNVDDPANLQRSEARFQMFRWGDLSLRMRRIFNARTSPTRSDTTFELFNGASSLGTITTSDVGEYAWQHVRIHARLGVLGAFNVTIDGISSTNELINTVATTPWADATRLWFSAGALGRLSIANSFSVGSIDNLLIDNAAFPAGRPSGRRVALASDGALTNWSVPAGGSVTAALATADATYARGTGAGSSALLNVTAPSTAGLSGVLGWQLQALRLSSVDTTQVRRLRTGVDVDGTPTNGTQVVAVTPPAAPSFAVAAVDTLFYQTGGADFSLAGVPNTKVRLEVAA